MSRSIGKVAFIHYAKASGRYVDYYLRSHVFDNRGKDLAEQQYKAFNSWDRPFHLSRDWTQAELLQLANNRFPSQSPTPGEIRTHHRCWSHDYLSKQYVHNHHYNWTDASVREFNRNGWFTFIFIREPADLLCSLWTWARNESSGSENPVLEPGRLIDLSLDAFIREIIETPSLHNFYALPDYLNDISYVAEFNENGFRALLKLLAPDQTYRPERIETRHRHASGNPGYTEYRRQGLISDPTHALLNDDPDVRRVRQVIANPS